VRSYFATTAAGLQSLGFRATPPLRQRTAVKTSELWVQLHVREETGDIASVAGAVTRGSAATTVLKRLEFRTTFSDGTEQWTTNLQVPEPYGPLPGVTTTRLPRLQDAAHLYRVHRKLVAARRGVTTKPARLDDAIAYIRESERRDREHKLARGFAVEDRGERVLRLTWRGALALHFSTAPGFKGYRAWREARAQEALLRQARAA
jgi:hypothetical protein